MTHNQRKTELLSLLAVLAVALAWRVIFLLTIKDTPLSAWHTWDQSDMFSFWQQARALAGGDWLARAPWHPYHGWMRVAPPEAWQPFFSRPAFYQAPLYSYCLALLMRFTGDTALWARCVQLILGVANVALVYGITRRIFGRGAAVAAGVLMGIYGPLLVIESQLLRDTLVLTLMLSVFFAYLSWTRARATASSPRWPLAIGALLGVLAMAHEGALMLTLAIVITSWLHLRHGAKETASSPSLNPRSTIRMPHFMLWFALGILLGYAPLLVRNLIVGAPLPPRFAGSAFAFAVANHATAAWGGASWASPSPALGAAIVRSGGSIPALVAGVLGSYDGEWWRWLGHWAMRLGALGIGAEISENVCQDYFAMRVPILAFTVDFRILLPLALAGATLWGRRRWRTAARSGSAALTLALDGLLVTLMLSMVLPLGRYRLMLLPALTPFAGRALFSLWLALRARRPGRLGLTLGLASLIALGQWGLGRALPLGGLRPADFKIAAQILLDWGHPDLAMSELRSGIDAGFPPSSFELEMAITLERAGQEAAAAALHERVLARDPGNSLALLRLGWLRAAASVASVRQPEEAGELASRYATLNPGAQVEGLDLTAAAAAARGDFASARLAAESALTTARIQGRQELADQIAKRLELYRQGHPFVR